MKVFCADISCEYNKNNTCRAKELALSWSSVLTVNDGRQEFLRCKTYQPSKIADTFLAAHGWSWNMVTDVKPRPIIGRWVQVQGGYMSPGGTPLYVCENCGGSEHLHGTEYPKRMAYCKECGQVNFYPWEKLYNEDEDNEDDR